MFKWIDSFFEDRESKKKVGSNVQKRIDEVEDAFEIRLNEVEARYKSLLSDYQSKLETYCNLHFEMSKEKYEKKREEFDTFIDDACERIKGEFTKDCSKQDLKKMIQGCFNSYIGEIDFAIRPRLVEDREELNGYVLSMIKTTAFSRRKKFNGGNGINRGDFTENSINSLYHELIEEGLELGAKLGTDIMHVEVERTDTSEYKASSYGAKVITINTVLNFTFYNVERTLTHEEQSNPGQDTEDMILGTYDGLEEGEEVAE